MKGKRWIAGLLCLAMLIAIPAQALANPDEEAVETEAAEVETIPAEETEDQGENSMFPMTLDNEDTEEPEETEPEKPFDYTVEYALSNGSFQLVKDYENLEDAVAAAKADRAEAVVRDAKRTHGNGVVYMNRGIAITAPGRLDPSNVLLTYGKSSHVSYTGAGYDALYLGGDGVSVSIRLMGMEGPVHTNEGLRPVDQVELIPSVHKPEYSYYKRSEGQLTHYVQQYSYDAKSNSYGAKAFPVALGPAPSFMAEDRPYYSYNAENYYVDPYSTDSVGYFEPYFKILPLRSYTNYTAEELDRYIASWYLTDSKLNGTGAIFIHAQNKTGVNAALLLSMAAHESAKGTSRIAQDKNNLFGVNATDANPYGNAYDFHSVAHNIEYQAQVKMNDQYLNHADNGRYRGPQLGDKYSGMNVKYASDPYWAEKIVGHMVRLDAYLGNKDMDKYGIGWVRTPAFAYAPKGWPEAAAHPLHANSFAGHVPMIVTGQKDNYYIARSIMPLNDLAGDIKATYNIKDRVYIAREQMGTIRGAVGEPAEPAQTPYMYVERLAGNSRFDTAVAISQRYTDRSDTVLLANGYNEIDALSAAPLAGYYKAPILLVRDNGMPDIVRNEIKRLGAKHIIIVGGPNAISKGVEDALVKENYTISRFQGEDRYETGAAISKEVQRLLPDQTRVFLANGESAVDAMSVGPVAAKDGIPVLLTNGKRISESTREIMKKADGITLLGMENAISKQLETEIKGMQKTTERIGGSDRYESSVLIAKKYFEDPLFAAVSRGDSGKLADGLVGSVLAARDNAPLLLVGTEPKSVITNYLRKDHGDELFVLGGEEAIPAKSLHSIATPILR